MSVIFKNKIKLDEEGDMFFFANSDWEIKCNNKQ